MPVVSSERVVVQSRRWVAGLLIAFALPAVIMLGIALLPPFGWRICLGAMDLHCYVLEDDGRPQGLISTKMGAKQYHCLRIGQWDWELKTHGAW